AEGPGPAPPSFPFRSGPPPHPLRPASRSVTANPTEGRRMDHTRSLSTRSRWVALGLLTALLVAGVAGWVPAQGKPDGEMRWALYVTLAPVWLDPAEVQGQITPFWVLYAIHDALVKPMPGNLMSPSLAESWTVSPDQRVYEFKLREGLKFHNGDPFTAEDV